MQDVKQIVRVVHGSHLYGTNTPDSDQDFKSVHLPSGAAILLQRAENVIDTSVVAKDESGKNTADAIDNQSYSLQKFLQLITLGDMTATEMLFAPEGKFEADDIDWAMTRRVGKKLINRQVKGFVGYCRRQAAKYGIRGSRMAAVEGLRTLLQAGIEMHGAQAPLSELAATLKAYADATQHTAIENIAGGDKTTKMPHFVCCDRKMPYTAHLGEVFKVYDRVWQEYGERARRAKENDGIDWKAMSHAVRVACQALELLRDQHITFPRPEAEVLVNIKLGNMRYETVSEMLENLIERVENRESELPKKSDMNYLDDFVLAQYMGQLS